MSANKDQAISSGSHPVLALSKMKSLRENSALCDIILKVGVTEIPAHKVVLAASSPYFEFMFTSNKIEESSKDVIEIKGLCPKAFLAVVNFIYSGYLSVNENTIEDLLQVADFVKVAIAKEQCLNYMQKHVKLSNCVRIRNIAKKHFFLELEKKINNFISYNYLKVIGTEAFLELTVEELKSFITEESFCYVDSLCEKAISSWINHDKNYREDFRESLSQITSVHIERMKLKGLTLYNSSLQRRIFCFYNDEDFSYAFDLNNSTNYCVRRGPRFEHIQPVFHNNTICVVSAFGDECGIYNLKEDNWTSNMMSYKNFYSGVCSDHNRMHLTVLNSRATFSYDLERNVLDMEPSMIRERFNPGVTFSENCIYVCGGARGTAEFRDIRTKEWKGISCLPDNEDDVSACSLHDKIYCLSSAGEFYQYDKRQGVWMKKTIVPGGTDRFLVGATDEELYTHNGTALYKYNVKDDKWIYLVPVMRISNFVCVYPR